MCSTERREEKAPWSVCQHLLGRAGRQEGLSPSPISAWLVLALGAWHPSLLCSVLLGLFLPLVTGGILYFEGYWAGLVIL